jgi:hypothetical protein
MTFDVAGVAGVAGVVADWHFCDGAAAAVVATRKGVRKTTQVWLSCKLS